MSCQRYPEEIKIEAVKRVPKKAKLSPMSLGAWVCPCAAFKPRSRSKQSQEQRQQVDVQQAELRKLRAEPRRLTEEQDILKKAAAYFVKECG